MILSVGRRPGANTEGSGTGAGGFRRAGGAFFLLLRRRFLLTGMVPSHHFAGGCAVAMPAESPASPLTCAQPLSGDAGADIEKRFAQRCDLNPSDSGDAIPSSCGIDATEPHQIPQTDLDQFWWQTQFIFFSRL